MGWSRSSNFFPYSLQPQGLVLDASFPSFLPSPAYPQLATEKPHQESALPLTTGYARACATVSRHTCAFAQPRACNHVHPRGVGCLDTRALARVNGASLVLSPLPLHSKNFPKDGHMYILSFLQDTWRNILSSSKPLSQTLSMAMAGKGREWPEKGRVTSRVPQFRAIFLCGWKPGMQRGTSHYRTVPGTQRGGGLSTAA